MTFGFWILIFPLVYRKNDKKINGKIVDVTDIHPVKDEFTLTFDEYMDSFKDDPEFKEEKYREYIKQMYDIYEKNYSYLKMLGEDD